VRLLGKVAEQRFRVAVGDVVVGMG